MGRIAHILAGVALAAALVVSPVSAQIRAGLINLATMVTGTLPVANGGTGATASTGSGDVVLKTAPTITTPTIAALANLTTNGFVKTSGGVGTLSVDTATYLTAITGGTCTNQAVTAISTVGAPTCTTLTSAYVSGTTGSGNFVLATSPTLTTPVLGVATATSINGNIFTTGSSTYTGTAGQTYTFPTTSATIARTDAANSFTGAQTLVTNGALSAPVLTANGTWITGGTATTTKPYVLIEPTGTTSTAWTTNGTGLGVNAASGFTGNLLDVQKAGVTQATISSGGIILANEVRSLGDVRLATSGILYWNNNTQLYSDASGVLALRAGTNAMRFNVYNTFTSASVFEDLSLYFASNVAHIGTATTGATARVLQLDYGGTTTSAISIPITSGAVTFGGGITTPGGATFHTTNTALTDGAGASAGTLGNAPAVGNPTKWIGINDNGTVRYIPAW